MLQRALGNKIEHGCAVFDGSTGYINYGKSLNSIIVNNFTIEFWIKKDGTGRDSILFINEGVLLGIYVGISSTWENLYVQCNGNGSWGGGGTVSSNGAIPSNTWTHFTIVRDFTNLRLYIYQNGVLNKTTILTSEQVMGAGTGDLTVGSNISLTANRQLKGSIDEARIWNYARSAQQIRDNYKRSIQPEAGLVAYYKLDGNALDSSGNGNNGTVSGGVSWSVDGKVDTVTKVGDFNGVDSFISTGFNTALGTTNFSISIFYRLNLSAGSTNTLLGQYPASSKAIIVSMSSTTCNVQVAGVNLPSISIRLGVWQQLSIVRASGIIHQYLNGVLQSSTSHTNNLSSTSPYFIGAYQNSGTTPASFFNGNISYVRIFNTALSQQEIQDNMFRVLPASTPNLIEQWTLNGNASATVNTANNGTATNVTYIAEAPRTIADVSTELEKTKLLTSKFKLGSAVCNIPNNYTLIPHNNNLNLTTQISIEFWIKLPAYTTRYSENIRKSTANITSSPWAFYVFGNYQGNNSHGQMSFFGVANSTWQQLSSMTNRVELNTWTHIAWSYDSVLGGQLYVNGIALGNRRGSGMLSVNSEPIEIARTTVAELEGGFSLSDFRIWNYARTATQIAENFKRVLQPQAGLIAYYRLNGNALDSSGNGLHGTETNVGYSVDGYVPVTRVARFDGLSHIDTNFRLNTSGITTHLSLEVYAMATKDMGETIMAVSGGRTYIAVRDTNGKPIFSIDANGTQQTTRPSAAVVPLNTWALYTLTYDGVTLKGYVNGQLITSVYLNEPYTFTGTNGTLIIGKHTSETLHLTGSVSLLRVWSKALTQKEILDNMYKVLPGSTTGLLEQWTLNNTLNGTNGNNGTATPGVTFVPDTPKGLADVSRAVDKSAILLSKSRQPYMLNFDGGTQYANTNYGNGRNVNTSVIAMEALIRVKTLSSGSKQFFGTSVGNDQRFYVGRLSTSNNWTLGLSSSIRLTDAPIVVNKWTHMVAVLDGTNGKIFIDGVDATGGGSYTPFTLASDITIGQILGVTGANGHFDMAYFRIWNTVKQPSVYFADAYKILPSTTPNLERQFVPTLQGLTGTSGFNGVLVNNPQLLPSTAPVGQRSTLRFVGGHATVSSLAGVPAFGANSHTLEAWVMVMPDGLVNDYNYIMSIGNGTTTTRNQTSMGIRGTGTVFQSAYTSPIINFTYAVPVGVWTHLVITHANGVSTLYANGVFMQSVSISLNVLGTTVKIAAHATNGNLGHHRISLVRIWDKELIQADIQKNMHSYLPATTPNLIEQWRLNEGVGNIAYGDKGNHGTITGTATWTTPSLMNWRNKVARFSGGISLMSVPHNPTINLLNSGTVELWARSDIAFPSSTSTIIYRTLVTKGVSGSNDGFSYHFMWFGSDTSRVLYGMVSNGIDRKFVSFSNVDITTYRHVAFTFTPTTLNLYLDGVLVATATNNITIQNIVSNFSIGGGNGGTFQGSIDEVRVWNVARTATEIADNMNRSIGRHPNLVLNMNFDNGFHDSSGNGNHGTVVGSVTLEDSDNDKLLFNAPINDE